jgi:hypothetical protein
VKSFILSFCAVVLLLASQQSCTKIDTTTLGSNLIPAVDNVNTFDTLLDVYTQMYPYPDSTKIGFSEAHALGILEDPSFGNTTAQIYFNLYPARFGARPFPVLDSLEGRSIDSVILQLSYTQQYGDTNAVSNFTVYEMAQGQPFYDTLNYPINSPDFALGQVLGRANNYAYTRFNDVDSIEYPKGIKNAVQNVIRIPLDKNFGNRLFGYDTSNAYKNSTNFASYVKGYAVKAETNSPGKRALAYFSLTNANTRLQFFYRVKRTGGTTPITDTVTAAFNISGISDSGRTQYAPTANLIKRSINGTAYQANLANPNRNASELYLQSSPGSYSTLYIPGLKNLNNRLIHRAELVFTKQQVPGTDLYKEPRALYIDAIDTLTNGTVQYRTIPNDFRDGVNSGFGYNIAELGGLINGNNQYVFNLSRYVQGIVTKQEKVYTLRLFAPYSIVSYVQVPAGFQREYFIATPVSAGRVVLNGGGNATAPIKMRIIYSKI